MENIVILAIVGTLAGVAAGYVYRSKKRGVQCIGCPDAKHCSGSCPGCGMK